MCRCCDIGVFLAVKLDDNVTCSAVPTETADLLYGQRVFVGGVEVYIKPKALIDPLYKIPVIGVKLRRFILELLR